MHQNTTVTYLVGLPLLCQAKVEGNWGQIDARDDKQINYG